MSKTDQYLQNEAIRLRREADRLERKLGADAKFNDTIRLNRIYADRMEAELATA